MASMEITLNGNRHRTPSPTVAALVDELGLAGKRVAVEKNGEIVPRSGYAETSIADGDTLEIVGAVGGG